MKNDFYKVLSIPPNFNISPTSSPEEIETRIKFLRITYHPDRFPADKFPKEFGQLAGEILKGINEANETFSDPEKRKKYNERYKKEADETILSYEKIARLHIIIEKLLWEKFQPRYEKNIGRSTSNFSYPFLFCFGLYLRCKKDKRKLYINTSIEALKNNGFPICFSFDKATAFEKKLLKLIPNYISGSGYIPNYNFIESDAYSSLAIKINWDEENNDLVEKIYSIIKDFTDVWETLYETTYIQPLDICVTPLKFFVEINEKEHPEHPILPVMPVPCFSSGSTEVICCGFYLHNLTGSGINVEVNRTLYIGDIIFNEKKADYFLEANQICPVSDKLGRLGITGNYKVKLDIRGEIILGDFRVIDHAITGKSTVPIF